MMMTFKNHISKLVRTVVGDSCAADVIFLIRRFLNRYSSQETPCDISALKRQPSYP